MNESGKLQSVAGAVRPWMLIAAAFVFGFLGIGLGAVVWGNLLGGRGAPPPPSPAVSFEDEEENEVVEAEQLPAADPAAQTQDEIQKSIDRQRDSLEKRYHAKYDASREAETGKFRKEVREKMESCAVTLGSIDLVAEAKKGRHQNEVMTYLSCLAIKENKPAHLERIREIDRSVYEEKKLQTYGMWQGMIFAHEKGGAKAAVAGVPARECGKVSTPRHDRGDCLRFGDSLAGVLSSTSEAGCGAIPEAWMKSACKAVLHRNPDLCVEMRSAEPAAKCRQLATTLLALREESRDRLDPISEETSSIELLAHLYFGGNACEDFKKQIILKGVCGDQTLAMLGKVGLGEAAPGTKEQ